MKKAIVFLSLLLCAAGTQAQPVGCTQDTIVGTYGFLYEGFTVGAAGDPTQVETLPTVGLAWESIDAQGTVTTTGYHSVGSLLTEQPAKATILVNRDCTGTIDWGNGLSGNIAVLRDGEEMHSTGAPSAGSVVSGHWKRISRVPNIFDAAQCSVKNLAGSYVTEMHGFVMEPLPGASQRRATPLAGHTSGSVSATGVNLARGTIIFGDRISSITLNARFMVSSDCTFRWTNPSSDGRTWGVVLGGGNELWMIVLNDITGDPVFTANSRRTAPQ